MSRNPYKSDLIDVACDFVHETDDAIKVRSHVGGKVVWIPKSVGNVERDGLDVVLTLPKEYALDKGLI